MVQVASLIGEVARVKNELERVEVLRKEAETALVRSLLLLENCVNAIGGNDRDAMEKTGGAAREFLDRLREKASVVN
jgi:hypothetical protein